MLALLSNYGPTAVAIITALLAAFQPQVQAFVVAHPAVATAIGSIFGILAHSLPGSPLGGGTLGITPAAAPKV
jgi:hypothetical protein